MDHQSAGGSMVDHGMMGNMMGVKGGRASVCAIMTGHIEGRLGLRIALRGLRVTHVIGEAKYQ